MATRGADAPARGGDVGGRLLAAGGMLAGLSAASCCALPLLLFVMGVSGAWIGNLTALAPWQPLFVAAGLGFLAAGALRLRRRPSPSADAACAPGGYCARPGADRVARFGLWTAATLLVLALAFPYAPLLLEP